jgi:hypothetical protein
MMKWLLKLGLKFVSYQTLVNTIASAIAYILEYARKEATPTAWENAKEAVRQIKNWASLLDEVYEDDTLTSDEEKKIQNAIADCTATTTIYNLLKGKKSPKKETWSKTADPKTETPKNKKNRKRTTKKTGTKK